jgi:hypothetical protein
MNHDAKPDLVVNLGDDIEDESPEVDRARYGECLGILSHADADVRHVAGNHDTGVSERRRPRSRPGEGRPQRPARSPLARARAACTSSCCTLTSARTATSSWASAARWLEQELAGRDLAAR